MLRRRLEKDDRRREVLRLPCPNYVEEKKDGARAADKTDDNKDHKSSSKPSRSKSREKRRDSKNPPPRRSPRRSPPPQRQVYDLNDALSFRLNVSLFISNSLQLLSVK